MSSRAVGTNAVKSDRCAHCRRYAVRHYRGVALCARVSCFDAEWSRRANKRDPTTFDDVEATGNLDEEVR